jgi:hypothetical protein
MSALPPKANIIEREWHVRFVPKVEVAVIRSVKLIVQPDAHDVVGYPAVDRARARRLNVGGSSAAKLITRAP